MPDIFGRLAACGAERLMMLNDPGSGLRAIIALDDLTLGPACGGIRTQPYPSTADAIADVARLSRAMTLKCAIAGLDAGGGKTVVINHPGMERAAAFRRLGEHIEALGGLYRCAGDLGTTEEDLSCVADRTTFVNTTGERLGAATGAGIVGCIRACAHDRGVTDFRELRVAVQGCGLIGGGVARSMAAAGADVVVADIDRARAKALAEEIGGSWIEPDAFVTAAVDILSPCAVGSVLSPETVPRIRAWAVCGGANNQLTEPAVDAMLAARDIAYVPDFLASAGAVIDGIAPSVMDTPAEPLIARLKDTALAILRTAKAEGRGTAEVARAMALARIEAAARSTRAHAAPAGDQP